MRGGTAVWLAIAVLLGGLLTWKAEAAPFHVAIDEYQLLVHPVVLGGGKALLKDIADKHRLKLVSAKPFSSGVVLLTYQRF